MKIKNIIFDFGGVLFDISYQKTRDAFIQLGVENFDDYYSQTFCSPLFADLEKARIEPDEFYEAFKKQTGLPLQTDQIREAWCAMLLGYRKESMEFLEKLKQHYQIFLLSNTNAIHHQQFQQMHFDLYGTSLDTHFTKPYYSHLIGEHKPSHAAYQVILNENKLDPAETLFVDDTFKNIKPAEELGIQVCYLQNNGHIEVELKGLLES